MSEVIVSSPGYFLPPGPPTHINMTSSRYLGNATSQITIEWQPPLASRSPILGYYVMYGNNAFNQHVSSENVRWAVGLVSDIRPFSLCSLTTDSFTQE